MQEEVNYEALGRFVHLKQQREMLLLRLHAMKESAEDLAVLLESPRPGSCDRLLKTVDIVAAVLPEIRKIGLEVKTMTEEMKQLKAKYNLGSVDML